MGEKGEVMRVLCQCRGSRHSKCRGGAPERASGDAIDSLLDLAVILHGRLVFTLSALSSYC